MLGWVEGGNLRGDPDRLAAYADELVNVRPDLIWTTTGPAARAVQQWTAVIPIVLVGGGDPTSRGLVGNIARPGGNMTGFANNFGSLGGKWLELFKEALPGLTRVAYVFPTNEFTANPRDELRVTMREAAARLGGTIIEIPVHDTAEIESAISAFPAAPHGGLLMIGAVAPTDSEAIERLALHYRLPLMRGSVATVEEGILMSYGPDVLDLTRRGVR